MKKLALVLLAIALPCAAQNVGPIRQRSGPSQPTMVPGDLVCAVAGDTTIGTATVTAASRTGAGPYSVTYTMSATPSYYQIIGQKIGVTGASPSGYNVAKAAVTAYTSTTVTVSMASDPGTWSSGGTTFLACGNASNATSATAFQNAYTVQAGFWSSSSQIRAELPIVVWTSSSAPQAAFQVNVGSTTCASPGAFLTIGNSNSGLPGDIRLSVMGVSSTQVMCPGVEYRAGTLSLNDGASNGSPVTTVATSSQALTLQMWFTAATAGNAILVSRMPVSY